MQPSVVLGKRFHGSGAGSTRDSFGSHVVAGSRGQDPSPSRGSVGGTTALTRGLGKILFHRITALCFLCCSSICQSSAADAALCWADGQYLFRVSPLDEAAPELFICGEVAVGRRTGGYLLTGLVFWSRGYFEVGSVVQGESVKEASKFSPAGVWWQEAAMEVNGEQPVQAGQPAQPPSRPEPLVPSQL